LTNSFTFDEINKIPGEGDKMVAKRKNSFLFEDSDGSVIKSVRQQAEKLEFSKIARYRCSQITVTQLNGEVTFSAEIGAQYLLSTAKKAANILHVKLEDYIYQTDPKAMEAALTLVEPLEYLKNNIIFTQNRKGEFVEIFNFQRLTREWENFRDNKLSQIEFYQKLKEQSTKAAEDIINTGNMEFSDPVNIKSTLSRNLFYHILLRANVGEELDNYKVSQLSQLFPNQMLYTDVTISKVSEDASTITLQLVGDLNRENISDENLKKQYDELYKPVIKFNFSEFDQIYRIIYTIDLKTGLLIDAKAYLSESIKNNYESVTNFDLRRVEL